MNTWGYHLLLDCTAGKLEAVQSKEVIKEFVDRLVKDIDMVAYGDTWIERFATHDPGKTGISMCQMIETSNITGHFVDKDGNFYLDIFSCKPYNVDTVTNLVMEYFAPEKIKQHFISRDA